MLTFDPAMMETVNRRKLGSRLMNPGRSRETTDSVGFDLDGTIVRILNTIHPTKVCQPWNTIGNWNPSTLRTYLLVNKLARSKRE